VEATEEAIAEHATDVMAIAENLEHRTDSEEAPVVYITTDISPEGLLAIYEALEVIPEGNVAIKLHTGEGEDSNHLRPEFINDLVQLVDGTIVECNTAYGGSRAERRAVFLDYSVSAECHFSSASASCIPFAVAVTIRKPLLSIVSSSASS
jgi:uncharacterized Fe-S center protein